jgi:hypothetical protein
MRTRTLVLGLALLLGSALAGGGCATLDQPSAQTPVRYEDGGQLGDAGYFYDSLSPYGRWVELSPYGLVWLPDGLGPGWSPYSQGFWTYSDYGWTWVDQEPWGWAPFHYGRWWLDPQYAWVWIPGTEWAPAWVAWRESDAYVAWAPLPPTIHWSLTVPLHSGGSDVAALPTSWWNVARPYDLLDTGLRNRLVPTSDKVTALARTEDRTRITVAGDRPFNEGVSVNWIESRLGRTVPRYRVVDAPEGGPNKSGVVDAGSVALFRPDLAQRAHRNVARPDLRQGPPQATVAPARRDSLKLEGFLDGERKRMQNEQQLERDAAHGDDELTALAQQHAREARAFDAWAAGQRKRAHQGGWLKVPQHFNRKTNGGGSETSTPAADSTRAR